MEVWQSISNNLQHLMGVPGQLISIQGLGQGVAFATLSYVQGAIDPMIRNALRGAPLSQLTIPILDGTWVNANINLGLRAHGVKG